MGRRQTVASALTLFCVHFATGCGQATGGSSATSGGTSPMNGGATESGAGAAADGGSGSGSSNGADGGNDSDGGTSNPGGSDGGAGPAGPSTGGSSGSSSSGGGPNGAAGSAPTELEPGTCRVTADCPTGQECLVNAVAGDRMIPVSDPCTDAVTACTEESECTDPEFPLCGPHQGCPAMGTVCNPPCGDPAAGEWGCWTPFQCNLETRQCELPACLTNDDCGFGYRCNTDESQFSLEYSYAANRPLGCQVATCGEPNAAECSLYELCEPEHPDAAENGCRTGHCEADGIDCGSGLTCDPDAPEVTDSGCRVAVCDTEPGEVDCGNGSCSPDDPDARANGCVFPNSAGAGGTGGAEAGGPCATDPNCPNGLGTCQ